MWKQIISNSVTWIILATVAIVAFIYFYGRAAGKRKALQYVTDLPNSGSGIPLSWDPVPLAQTAHDVLVWNAWTDDKNKWMDEVSALTDDQLTAVYNTFNTKYLSEGYGTLYDWLNNTSAGLLDSRKSKLLLRMAGLKLIEADPKDLKSWFQRIL